MSDQPSVTNINTAQLPETWQAYVPLATALVRTLLVAAGSAGFMWAQTVSASDIQMGVGMAMIIASGCWSLWQKIQAQRALRQAAAAPMLVPPPKLPA
jgi:ABC-type nickel/cobalt efflux system permease component RcnA